MRRTSLSRCTKIVASWCDVTTWRHIITFVDLTPQVHNVVYHPLALRDVTASRRRRCITCDAKSRTKRHTYIIHTHHVTSNKTCCTEKSCHVTTQRIARRHISQRHVIWRPLISNLVRRKCQKSRPSKIDIGSNLIVDLKLFLTFEGCASLLKNDASNCWKRDCSIELNAPKSLLFRAFQLLDRFRKISKCGHFFHNLWLSQETTSLDSINKSRKLQNIFRICLKPLQVMA